MTFADDDLKRLKDCIRTAEPYESAPLTIQEFRELLARLEAAEEYIKQCRSCHGFALEAEESWRKACGQ